LADHRELLVTSHIAALCTGNQRYRAAQSADLRSRIASLRCWRIL